MTADLTGSPPPVPAGEVRERCRRLQQQMQRAGLDAVIVLQNADLYYFSGTLQSGLLYLPAVGDPLYLVRRELERARCESALTAVLPFRAPRDLPGRLAEAGLPQPATLGLELDVLPVRLYQSLIQALPGVCSVDATPLIRALRAVKSPYEIELMRVAGKQTERVWRHALQVAREGMSSLELTIELDAEARRAGHPGRSRMRAFNSESGMGLVLAGAEAAVPAYRNTPLGGPGLHPSVGFGSGGASIRRGEPVVVDCLGMWGGYLSDQTRVLAFGGLDDQLRRAYDQMLAIETHLRERARPGISWGALYESCCDLAGQAGYADHFMGLPGWQVTFIGHGIGLEIDEYPFIARGFEDQVLEENMTFAFEPKAVFAGLGAVGIENTYLVTAQGLEALTCADPSLAIL